MNPHDLIANRIIELLRPDSFDAEEEKKLRERNEIRKGEITLINCLHRATITHTNGNVQCLSCKRMLKIIEPKWKKEE